MSLIEIVKPYAASLTCPSSLQPVPLLLAIADVESSGGANNVPKHEDAYDRGGLYWKEAAHVKDAVRRWGAFAACSYSSWQLLYIVAVELGLGAETDPAQMRDDVFAIPWVIAALNRRVFARGAQNIQDVADGWNSGSFTDTNKPLAYIEAMRLAYEARI